MNRLTILMIVSFIMFSCKESGINNDSNSIDSSTVKSNGVNDNEFTCPMHPEIVRKEAGSCPECGMELQIRS